MDRSGIVLILNGPPRSGKSSIAAAVEAIDEGPWTLDGVDSTVAATPEHLHPGIGLRPGGERPDLEEFVSRGYRELFDKAAVHAKSGRNVVLDVGIHDWYTRPLGIWTEAALRMESLAAYVVGVHCSLDLIVQRRIASPDRGLVRYESTTDGAIAEPVLRWQEAVHEPGRYDLVVDTTSREPERCARTILSYIDKNPPRALGRWLWAT